jgi:hypothetical protein
MSDKPIADIIAELDQRDRDATLWLTARKESPWHPLARHRRDMLKRFREHEAKMEVWRKQHAEREKIRTAAALKIPAFTRDGFGWRTTRIVLPRFQILTAAALLAESVPIAISIPTDGRAAIVRAIRHLAAEEETYFDQVIAAIIDHSEGLRISGRRHLPENNLAAIMDDIAIEKIVLHHCQHGPRDMDIGFAMSWAVADRQHGLGVRFQSGDLLDTGPRAVALCPVAARL